MLVFFLKMQIFGCCMLYISVTKQQEIHFFFWKLDFGIQFGTGACAPHVCTNVDGITPRDDFIFEPCSLMLN